MQETFTRKSKVDEKDNVFTFFSPEGNKYLIEQNMQRKGWDGGRWKKKEGEQKKKKRRGQARKHK